MINFSALKRQHEEIGDIIGSIKNSIYKNQLEAEANEVALLVSSLAGKLKIHLNAEDLYMYPDLLKSQSGDIRLIAKEYIDEMGHISEAFTAYKNRFNTRSKITADIEAFKSETKKVFAVLEERISKEEASLYSLLQL
jgi:hypothetical protein